MRALYKDPSRAMELDDEFDANLPCQVARRASLAQGRAMVKLLDRALVGHCKDQWLLEAFNAYRSTIAQSQSIGHLGIAFALAGCIVALDVERLVYCFLHAHAKAVLSAAVRLSLIGPYESTAILAGQHQTIANLIDETQNLQTNQATQTFSILDIYQGRHELLYSRLFSS